MPLVYKEVEVDVDLSDFDDQELIDELDQRGLGAEVDSSTASDLINVIWHKRRMKQDYERELDQLLYQVTGRAL